MQALAIVVLAFWVLAFCRTLVNLMTTRRLGPAGIPAREPFVSIVIPARDEARMIERSVRAFLAQEYSSFEVVVVDDRSTDGTGEIVRRIEDGRLILVKGEEPAPGWLGKPWALEQGSRRARGELLLFADADIIYAPLALRAAVAELIRSEAAMIALLPHFEMKGFAENAAMGMLPFTFTALPVWLSNRSRAPWLAMGGGSGNLIRRRELEAIGYFTALSQAVVDDIALARLVRRAGGKTSVVRADDLIRVRMYRGAREIADGFTKNVFFALGRSYAMAMLIILVLILFHLLPYSLAMTGDPLWIATVILISTTRLVLFRSLHYRLDNALFLHPAMALFWLYIVLRSVWFVGVRNEVRWRGRTYDAAGARFGAGR